MLTAPIVLFAFNRPKHTARLIESLIQNREAAFSSLIVYLDFPRKNEDFVAVQEVKKTIILYSDKFKNVCITERNENYGCKRNVISGVSEVLARHRSIIVLEDDLVVGPYFLNFMNEALNTYKDVKEVYHISGYSDITHENSEYGAFFTRGMNCWGWATWSDRWIKLNLDVDNIKEHLSQDKIKWLNFNNNHDFFRQIEENSVGIIKTWAIFWYASILINRGLCLEPCKTLTVNNGNDGSGERTGAVYVRSQPNDTSIINLPSSIIECPEGLELKINAYRKQKNMAKTFIKFLIYKLPYQLQKKVMRFMIKTRGYILNQ